MKKLLLGLSLLVLGFGCARESNNNANTNTNTGVYTMNQYGQCVQSPNGAVVQASFCQNVNTNNNGFTLWNGQCVQTATGQPVPFNYCQQGQNVGAQQCYGPYSYNGQIYQCGIQNDCRGYTMINPQTGQQVLCQ